jgi:hypothetical protein
VPLQRHTAARNQAQTSPGGRDDIDQFWNCLGAEERGKIEQELVREAPPFLREQYLDGQQERGLLFQTVRQAMIDDYVRKSLAARSNAA